MCDLWKKPSTQQKLQVVCPTFPPRNSHAPRTQSTTSSLPRSSVLPATTTSSCHFRLPWFSYIHSSSPSQKPLASPKPLSPPTGQSASSPFTPHLLLRPLVCLHWLFRTRPLILHRGSRAPSGVHSTETASSAGLHHTAQSRPGPCFSGFTAAGALAPPAGTLFPTTHTPGPSIPSSLAWYRH